MRRTRTTILLAMLAGFIATMVGAGPVAATGPTSRATIVAEWGSAVFRVSRNGWVVTVRGSVRDERADGDCVYAKASLYVDGWTDPDKAAPQNCSGSASGDWKDFSFTLRAGGGYRFSSIRVDICADDFPPDSCEGRTIPVYADRARHPEYVDEINRFMAMPMRDFLRAKRRAPGPFDWNDNGCSSVDSTPQGFNFLPACKRHDFGYRNYGNGLKASPKDSTREYVDQRFRQDLYNHCSRYQGSEASDCYAYAYSYYHGVRRLGGPHFYDN
jgi:hypothetical protein